MTDRSVWAASLLQSESLKFHSPCGLHPLQGFHARQRHGTGCPTKPLWQCRKAALHPQQPVTKIENWKPQILQMEIQSVWRNEADTLQFLEKDPIQKCLGRLKNHWRSTYMRFCSICKPITILTTTPHSAICRRMTWCKAQKEQWAAARYKPYFKIQVDLGHVTPRHPEPASLSARRRSSEHGDVPKSRITSSDPQSKGFFRIHIDSSWFMWILNWGNQIIDEWNRRFSFNAFISHGFILSVCWQYIIDSNSEHQQHHGTAWFHPHFLSDSPRISSLSISSKRTEIGFLAPHRAAYQGAPAWTWLHWYAKNLLRFLKASSSSFTAGNAGAPHLSAFGRSVVWWGKRWNVLDVGSDGLGGYENKGTSKSGGKDWNGYQTSNIITLIRQTTTCQLV